MSTQKRYIPGPLHPRAQSNPAGARLSRTPSFAEQHIREHSESHLNLTRRLNEEMAYTKNQVGPAGCYIIEADLPSSSQCKEAPIPRLWQASIEALLSAPSTLVLHTGAGNQMLTKGFTNQGISQFGVYPPSPSSVLAPVL